MNRKSDLQQVMQQVMQQFLPRYCEMHRLSPRQAEVCTHHQPLPDRSTGGIAAAL